MCDDSVRGMCKNTYYKLSTNCGVGRMDAVYGQLRVPASNKGRQTATLASPTSGCLSIRLIVHSLHISSEGGGRLTLESVGARHRTAHPWHGNSNMACALRARERWPSFSRSRNSSPPFPSPLRSLLPLPPPPQPKANGTRASRTRASQSVCLGTEQKKEPAHQLRGGQQMAVHEAH
jgi:hypothetical protein